MDFSKVDTAKGLKEIRGDFGSGWTIEDKNGNEKLFATKKEAKEALYKEFGRPTTTAGGGCFTAETLVLTDNAAKRIADVVVGDVLLTYNSQGKIKTNRVSEALIFKNDHYFIINGKIKVTKMHRFFTEDGWKRVRDLEIGDLLQKSDGAFEAIRSKELVPAQLTVYSLEIEDNHNFFVSSNGKNGYLVHNHGGGSK